MKLVIQDGVLVGSYITEVQRYNVEIEWYDTVQYPSEPGCTHTIELTPLLTQIPSSSSIEYSIVHSNPFACTCTCFKLWCYFKSEQNPSWGV